MSEHNIRRITAEAEELDKTKKLLEIMVLFRCLTNEMQPEKCPQLIPKIRELQQKLVGDEMYYILKRHCLTEGELQINYFPRLDYTGRVTFYHSNKANYQPSDTRKCVRCSEIYIVNRWGNSFYKEKCMYHLGKPVEMQYGNSVEDRYRCCQQPRGSTGCEVAPVHVHHKNKFDTSGYITTSSMYNGYPHVFAMDCEMVYTTAGMEVARVTLINLKCDVVYETFVKPAHEILDYNTRFSGIQESDMRNVKTNLTDVQTQLLNYIDAGTILVGHSLECDLRALKIVHNSVVDTSVLYSNWAGIQLKTGLKVLAQKYLKMTIQDRSNGHNSKEDAVAAMQLVIHYPLIVIDILLKDLAKIYR